MTDRVVTTKDINSAIRRQLEKSRIVKIGDAEKGGLTGQDSIAVGLTAESEILVMGDAGDYFGAFNHGALITLTGTAGRFLGDSMSGGGLIMKGRVRHGVGIYQSGGIIVVKGSVEGDAGIFNKGGTIIINGKTGDNVGTYMNSGTLIITGSTGNNTGSWMLGGEIFVGGELEGIGENVKETAPTKKDLERLEKYFEHYGILYDNLDDYIKLVPKEALPFELNRIIRGGGK